MITPDGAAPSSSERIEETPRQAERLRLPASTDALNPRSLVQATEFSKFILDRTILLMLRRFHGLAGTEKLESELLHLKVGVQQSLLLKSEKRDEKMLSGEPESLHFRCVENFVVSNRVGR